jgi:hypothetical protein
MLKLTSVSEERVMVFSRDAYPICWHRRMYVPGFREIAKHPLLFALVPTELPFIVTEAKGKISPFELNMVPEIFWAEDEMK